MRAGGVLNKQPDRTEMQPAGHVGLKYKQAEVSINAGLKLSTPSKLGSGKSGSGLDLHWIWGSKIGLPLRTVCSVDCLAWSGLECSIWMFGLRHGRHTLADFMAALNLLQGVSGASRDVSGRTSPVAASL